MTNQEKTRADARALAADTWYTSVTCPVAGCILTPTHRHPEWRPATSAADLIDLAPDAIADANAIVDDIEPGTPEWDASEVALERQRRAGG